MRRLLLVLITAGGVVAHLAFHVPAAAAPLTGADAAKLRAVIRPLDGEDAFDSIPWEVSLWEARKKAAAAGKPVFLWEMDGHPLGCG